MTGCDCARCRTAKYETGRRNTIDSMIWSGGLFRRHPSAAVPFAVLILLETLFRWFSFAGSEIVLLVVLTSARGYVDLCAVDDLLDTDRGVVGRGWKVARRLPVALVARGLSVVVLLIPFLPFLFGITVFSALFTDLSAVSFVAIIAVVGVGILISLVAAVVVYVKMILVSEACFVGGAGVIGSLKESWRSVRFGRAKTVILVGTFSLIVGFLLFGVVGFGNGGGEDREGFLRIASSALTTAFYSALFTHLYVERRFERGRAVHTPSGASTSTPS